MKKWHLWTAAACLPIAFQGCLQNQPESDAQNILSTAAVTTCSDYKMKVTSYGGLANDIAANLYTSWVIGNTTNTNGYRIYQWNGGNGWNDYGGGATRITLGAGIPYIVNSIGDVYCLSGTWVKYQGAPAASDIALPQGGGTLTVISKTDGKVYQKTGSSWNVLGSQQALAVSIDGMNKTWIASIDGNNQYLKYWDGSQWITVSGQYAYDVAAAENGMVYVASSEPGVGGGEHIIYKWNASCWARVTDTSGLPLAAKSLHASSAKKIWFVRGDRKIYSAEGP